jgi:hypothetical protein
MSIRPRQMEMFVASQTAEPLGADVRLLEIILERRNMFSALCSPFKVVLLELNYPCY